MKFVYESMMKRIRLMDSEIERFKGRTISRFEARGGLVPDAGVGDRDIECLSGAEDEAELEVEGAEQR